MPRAAVPSLIGDFCNKICQTRTLRRARSPRHWSGHSDRRVRQCERHPAPARAALEPLGYDLSREEIDPGQVGARAREAGDEAQSDRVLRDQKDDGDRRGRRLGCDRGGGTHHDDRDDATADEIVRQRRQPLGLIVGPTVFDSEPSPTINEQDGRLVRVLPPAHSLRFLTADWIAKSKG
jgi:hypothetical protein